MGRRDNNPIRLSAALAAVLCVTAAADAASLTNKDSESHVIIVTEGGVKTEFSISAGETVNFCDEGCFVTLPRGDKAALSGSETLDIVDEEAVIK